MHLPCAFDAAVFFVELSRWMCIGSMVQFFVVAADDAHDVCFIVVAIFVDGTEFLFGKEALPLALPTIVITVR